MSAKKTNSVDFNYLGDKKLEKGKKGHIQESNAWKKQAPAKEKREEQKEAVRKVKKEHMQRQEKVSWRKRTGGIVAILFLCGVGLFQFISQIAGFVTGSGISTLDVHDTAGLKRVLFGGEPWLVYCVDNQTESQRLPQVLTESAGSLKRSLGLRIGTLRCWEATESGRSVAQRFKLKLKPPLSFVVANGNKPRVLNLVGISKGEELEKRIGPALKLEIQKIDSLKKWSSLCSSRKACVVIGHKITAQRDTAVTLLQPLLRKHRTVRMVTLDTSFWQLKLDEGLLSTRSTSEGKRADVLCLSKQDARGNATYHGLFLQNLDSSSASALLQACEQQAGLVSLKSAPQIKARPSKPKPATTPAPRPPPRPSPPPPPAGRPKDRANVDHVGSREKLESEDEGLFESVEGDGEEEQEGEAEEEEESGEEVEL